MGCRALFVRAAPLIGIAALVLAATPARAEPVAQFCGYAHDLESGKYRYTELHRQQMDADRWLGGTITYVAPDGTTLGKKELSFGANPFIPVYRLELFGGRYVEGIERVDADRVFAYRKPLDGDTVERKEISFAPVAAADSGFHALIRANLAALVAGETRRFGFIVAGGLDAYRFRVRRNADVRFENRVAVRLLAQPDSLLRLLVAPLDLTYDPGSGQLLEYRGRSNLIERDSGRGFDVRIVFAAEPPADVPPAAAAPCTPDPVSGVSP